MIIQSKYSKEFVSNELTHQKYNELYDFTIFIRNHKNKVLYLNSYFKEIK